MQLNLCKPILFIPGSCISFKLFFLSILDLHVGHVGGEAQKNIYQFYCGHQPAWAKNIVWFVPRDWLQVKNRPSHKSSFNDPVLLQEET